MEDAPDAFANHLYWTREFVGLGPYRLERWEPGSFIEATAFDAHTLGRPKIDRIKMVFISDANTALANLLSEEIHLSADTSLRLEQGAIVKREWGPRNAGTVLQHPNQWRTAMIQLRPDMVLPKALLDARVRKALAHTIDKHAINEALYSGEGILADFIISPKSEFGPAAESAIVRYPLDIRRSEQLMNEAGFSRGADGMYTMPGEGRFSSEVKTNAAADNEAEIAILASTWRQSGFDFHEAALPAALAQDGQARSTFPGVYTFNTGVGESTLIDQTTSRIPRVDNRWAGGNRGGWSNAEYDRLVESFTTTLDREERGRQVARMAAIYTEELPAISLFFRTQPWAFVSALRGLTLVAPEANMAWNVHEWEFR
jgi:peptide/nickel transport system substrate-binding protein